jgi:ribonuclease HI
MWSFWNSRNDRLHGKEVIEPRKAIEWAIHVCLQLLPDTPTNGGRVTHVAKWSKPPPCSVKVNTDGAYEPGAGTGATGAIIRRADGSFMTASARRLASLDSALMAEAEALRDGVRLLPQDLDMRVIMETDSQELVALWHARKKTRPAISAILHDIDDLAARFVSFSVTHVRSSANNAAHVCAKNAPVTDVAVVWVNQPPSFLQVCLLNNCNST